MSESLKDHQIRRRVVVGTASNYAGQVVSFAALFLLTPFVLHRLGPSAYGLWVLLSSLVAYGSLLDLGLWGAIIKYVAEYRARGENEAAQTLIATALRMYAGLGLLVVVVGVLAAGVVPGWFNVPDAQRGLASQLMLLMSLGVGASLPGMLPLSILRGLQRYDLVSVVDVVATLFTAALTASLLLLGGGVLGVVAANLAGVFVMLGLSAWLVHRAAPELRYNWRGADRRQVRTILGYSWPLFVKDAAGRLQTRTDEITIGAFLPVAAIAPYNVARRLSEATHILTKQFMKVLLPLASELHAENDRQRLRQLLTAGTRVTLALSLGIGATLSLLAGSILAWWVGPQYADAANLVTLLALASFLTTSQWPAGAVLQGMSRHRVLAATALGSGLANVALSIALVGPLGVAGVALGTLIPSAVEFALIVPFAMRAVGVSPGSAIKEVFLPALGPAVLLVLVVNSLRPLTELGGGPATLAVAGAGLAVYGSAYLGLGASRAERATYRGLAFGLFRLARTHLWGSG